MSTKICISRKDSPLCQEEITDDRMISHCSSLHEKTWSLELSFDQVTFNFVFASPTRTGESSYRACFSFHSSYSEVRGSHRLRTSAAFMASGGISFSTAQGGLWLFLKKCRESQTNLFFNEFENLPKQLSFLLECSKWNILVVHPVLTIFGIIYKNFTISLENWAFIIKWDNMTGWVILWECIVSWLWNLF